MLKVKEDKNTSGGGACGTCRICGAKGGLCLRCGLCFGCCICDNRDKDRSDAQKAALNKNR